MGSDKSREKCSWSNVLNWQHFVRRLYVPTRSNKIPSKLSSTAPMGSNAVANWPWKLVLIILVDSLKQKSDLAIAFNSTMTKMTPSTANNVSNTSSTHCTTSSW